MEVEKSIIYFFAVGILTIFLNVSRQEEVVKEQKVFYQKSCLSQRQQVHCGSREPDVSARQGSESSILHIVSDSSSVPFRLLMDNRIKRVPENTFQSLWKLAEL